MTERSYDELFRQALLIRKVEEKIIELYPDDLIQSPVHLSIGQEAAAVGVCASLEKEDWLFINYRGHAFYLAKGGPLPEFFAELMGRKTGLSQGKAGSMHLAAPEFGVMGSSAVVGSTISHAVGAALANNLKKEKRVFVANFGDGATEQGVFHESLNFASLMKLPVLFLCEDNGLAVHAKKEERQAFDIRKIVDAYDMPFFDISEGYDFMLIQGKLMEVVSRVRQDSQPCFVRINTARYREHVGPGLDFGFGYRDETEFEDWYSKDPLKQDNESIIKFEDSIDREIDKAVAFGLESAFPGKEDLCTDVI